MDKNIEKYDLNQNGSWIKIDRKFNLPVNLYVDNTMVPSNDGINIAFICEPQSISNIKNFIIENNKYYDVILTHNKEILEFCDNAEMFEFGSCWVTDLESVKEKTLSVSFLVGGKSMTEGHRLRHEIWNNQNKITLPKKFFNSSNHPFNTDKESKFLLDGKEPLFNSLFHICIENCKEDGYFSEKLIDCFYTKTIPIYWGCPDIGKWFNTESIIIVNSLDDIINVCNNLDENFYNDRLQIIEENFNNCKKFLYLHTRICDKIEEIVKRYE